MDIRTSTQPWFLRIWRSLNAKAISLYQQLHLIFGTMQYQASLPSDHVNNTAGKLFHLLDLRKQIRNSDDPSSIDLDKAVKLWEEVTAMLRECSELESLTQCPNQHGFNVFLVAVLNSDEEILQMLINEGCSLNLSKCTMPLHMACKYGDFAMVKFLLNNGCEAQLEAGMCYPNHHAPIVHVPSRFHFLETDIYRCDSEHKLAMMYAIEGDHVDIVKYMQEWEESPERKWQYSRYPLHYACQMGSTRCMEYLAEKWPQHLQTKDYEGMTPLLHGVQWGMNIVKFLIDHGVDVHVTTPSNQTTLHQLFANIKDPLQLYETTKFLLGTGMEQDVNVCDVDSKSCLHELLSQVNCKVDTFSGIAMSDDTMQADFDQQVLDSMELLLSFNCDANIYNSSGVTALHKLIVTLDMALSEEPGGITVETLTSREKYKTDFKVLNRALDILLRHGAYADATTSAGRTAIMILLQMTCRLKPKLIRSCSQGILDCIKLLCKYGAKPSRSITSHINIITGLTKIGHKCLAINDTKLKQEWSEFVRQLIELLVESGLECNHCSDKKQPSVQGASGNLLLEIIKLSHFVVCAEDLDIIHKWVLLLLQLGANPDLEPYPSDSFICQSQSNIFLKPKGSQAVNQYMMEIQLFEDAVDKGHVEKLLLLFFMSMDHNALYQCMGTAKLLSRFDPNSNLSMELLNTVQRLSSSPRTLQQMCRVTIFQALRRRLKYDVPKLPLPQAMRSYLLNIE